MYSILWIPLNSYSPLISKFAYNYWNCLGRDKMISVCGVNCDGCTHLNNDCAGCDAVEGKVYSVEYPAACCGDGKLPREPLLNNQFIFLATFVL